MSDIADHIVSRIRDAEKGLAIHPFRLIGGVAVRPIYAVHGHDIDALVSKITRLTAEVERLRAAVSWLMPPFVDENTPLDELRQRIGFLVADVNRADQEKSE